MSFFFTRLISPNVFWDSFWIWWLRSAANLNIMAWVMGSSSFPSALACSASNRLVFCRCCCSTIPVSVSLRLSLRSTRVLFGVNVLGVEDLGFLNNHVDDFPSGLSCISKSKRLTLPFRSSPIICNISVSDILVTESKPSVATRTIRLAYFGWSYSLTAWICSMNKTTERLPGCLLKFNKSVYDLVKRGISNIFYLRIGRFHVQLAGLIELSVTRKKKVKRPFKVWYTTNSQLHKSLTMQKQSEDSNFKRLRDQWGWSRCRKHITSSFSHELLVDKEVLTCWFFGFWYTTSHTHFQFLETRVEDTTILNCEVVKRDRATNLNGPAFVEAYYSIGRYIIGWCCHSVRQFWIINQPEPSSQLPLSTDVIQCDRAVWSRKEHGELYHLWLIIIRALTRQNEKSKQVH